MLRSGRGGCLRPANRAEPGVRPGQPLRVTPVATAAGARWLRLPALSRTSDGDTYRGAGFRGRLDWQLPLNGEWSDLVASFDLVEDGDTLAFALAALRVP